MLVGVIAALSTLVAILIPVLRLILPLAVFLLSFALLEAALVLGIVGLLSMLMYALPLIAGLTCTSIILERADPSVLVQSVASPPRLILSAIGVIVAFYFLWSYPEELLYFMVVLAGTVWISEQYLGGIRMVLAQGESSVVRLTGLREYFLRVDSTSQRRTAADSPSSSGAKRSSWSSLMIGIDEAVESPARLAEGLRSIKDGLERVAEGLLTEIKKRLRRAQGQAAKLMRWYFGLFNFVLMATVLLLVALIPFATYRLGESIAVGRTYYALEPHGSGFWGLLVVPPIRAEPAQIFSESAASQPPSSSRVASASPLVDGDCVLYLGASGSTAVIYRVAQSGSVKGEVLRVSTESWGFVMGDQVQ